MPYYRPAKKVLRYLQNPYRKPLRWDRKAVVKGFTPALHAERMLNLGRDLLNDRQVRPYLLYYLQNPTAKDDPAVTRKKILDVLMVPTNITKKERWNIASDLLDGLVDRTSSLHKVWNQLQTHLQKIAPACGTLKACLRGCEVYLPDEAFIQTRTEGIVPIYFASGSNNAGEILGFAQSGMNVGVAVPEIYKNTPVHKASQTALKDLEGTGTKVFVDSGAFAEVGFKKGVPYVKEAITDTEWKKRLGMYVELAEVLGNQIYLVAPDKIASQSETLERLKKYLPILDPVFNRSKSARPNLIVPIPQGEIPLIEVDKRIRQIIGRSDYIRGIPMKNNATTLPQLVEFVKQLYKDKSVPKPIQLHILGKGRVSGPPDWSNHIRPELEKIDPNMEVSLDSVRLRSITGRGGKAYQDKVAQEVRQEVEKTFKGVRLRLPTLYAQRLREEHEKAKQIMYEDLLAQRLAPKRLALTLQRDEILNLIIVASLKGESEVQIGRQRYLIPSFRELWDKPNLWMTKTARNRVSKALKNRFPAGLNQNRHKWKKYLKVHPHAVFMKLGGMDRSQVRAFNSDIDGWFFKNSHRSRYNYDQWKYREVMAFLYGENFSPLQFEQDPDDPDYRFLAADDGIMVEEFIKYLESRLSSLIKKGSLQRLTPTQKGLSLQNPYRNRPMKKYKYRRNPTYETELLEDKVVLCDDYVTDQNCADGDSNSELYHATLQYKRAWEKARKAQGRKKQFPTYTPHDQGCPTSQVLYDGLGRQYLAHYKVFRTDSNGEGPIYASNYPFDFNPTPEYPKKLQARNLNTKEEKAKIGAMANRLEPIRLLTHHADATLGAPVVWQGKKGEYFALAGNGRTIALLMTPDSTYKEYERLGRELWGSLWPKGKDPKGKRSVLVRVITRPDGKNLTIQEAIKFAGGSQVSTSGKESPLREAISYRRALGVDPSKDKDVPSFVWYGELTSDNVQAFYDRNRGFVEYLTTRLSPAQKARIENDDWVLAKTITMVLTGFLPEEIAETGFANVKEEDALLSILPALVYLQSLVKKGRIKPEWNLINELPVAKTLLGKIKRKSYKKALDFVLKELPTSRKQMGFGGVNKTLLESLTPLGIGLGLFLKKMVSAADPASKSILLQGYIEEAQRANSNVMFAIGPKANPVATFATQVLQGKLGEDYIGAMKMLFPTQNPSNYYTKSRFRRYNSQSPDRMIVRTTEAKPMLNYKSLHTYTLAQVKKLKLPVDEKSSYITSATKGGEPDSFSIEFEGMKGKVKYYLSLRVSDGIITFSYGTKGLSGKSTYHTLETLNEKFKNEEQAKEIITNIFQCIPSVIGQLKPPAKSATSKKGGVTWKTLKPSDFKRTKDFANDGLYFAKIDGGDYYIFKDTDGIKAWYVQRSKKGKSERFSMATTKTDAVASLKKKFQKQSETVEIASKAEQKEVRYALDEWGIPLWVREATKRPISPFSGQDIEEFNLATAGRGDVPVRIPLSIRFPLQKTPFTRLADAKGPLTTYEAEIKKAEERIRAKWEEIVQEYHKGVPEAVKKVHAEGLELVPNLRLQDRIDAVTYWLDGRIEEYREIAKREGRISKPTKPVHVPLHIVTPSMSRAELEERKKKIDEKVEFEERKQESWIKNMAMSEKHWKTLTPAREALLVGEYALTMGGRELDKWQHAKRKVDAALKKKTTKPSTKRSTKKKRSWTKKPATIQVWSEDEVFTYKPLDTKNVWALYKDTEDGVTYTIVVHMPSGFEVFDSEDYLDANYVYSTLYKKLKMWQKDLDLGVKPQKTEIDKMYKIIESVAE